MKVSLVHITPDAEKVVAYCARVSSPNQDNPEYEKLLRYCAKNGHWSVFEMSSMCLEIQTSRAISAQILRHKSFSFQEFSQRYAKTQEREVVEARLQDIKNRQNSLPDEQDEHGIWFKGAQDAVWSLANTLYNEGLDRGLAKEQMRFLLPMASQTKLYMNGNLRSWIHYCEVRCDKSTQQEHRDIALECKRIFTEQCPTIAKALDWT